MKRSTVRKRLLQAAGVAVVAFVLFLILFLAAAGTVVDRSGREAAALVAELDSGRPNPRPEPARAEVVGLARDIRSRSPAPPASVAPPAAPAPAAAPSHDARFGRDPAERPLHDWLREVRLTRNQPGPAPPPEALGVLAELAPALAALAEQLSRAGVDETAPFVVPGEREDRVELEHAHVLLLAAAAAESLSPSGDPARGERLLEAAWTLGRGLPAGIDDAGPGDLFLAVMRQVRVADARTWSDRIEEMSPRLRLVDALEWDAAARMARHERKVEMRRQVKPGWVPAAVQRFLGGIATKHDVVFATGMATAAASLAENVRALDPCDDPWQLAILTQGWMGILSGPPGEVRLRTALASASLAQADSALTRHVLLRRHGLEAPRDACGTQPLIERHDGGDRYLVGWRVPGSEEPGAADRERPRNHSANFRTWPAPSLPGPPLEPFSFEATAAFAPTSASAPTR